MTLGFGEIVRLILVNADWLTRRSGHHRTSRRPPSVDLFEIPHLGWDGFVARVDLPTRRGSCSSA